MKRICTALLFASLLLGALSAQEALLSTTENYYEFLALDGYAERNYLNFRTLSDSAWTVAGEGDIWSANNLGQKKNLTDDISLKIYGPELFSSYNSSSPYGQNDGALWQGKGFNSSLSGGARLEGYGFELTVKPQVSFSQNLAFDLVTPVYSGAAYAGKADTYGYFGVPSIDAPQRFGDEAFFDYSFGDSEIRYTWKTLTAGFGTQSIWLGPAKINPILHSNNAAPYPKADIGLRRQPVTVLGVYLGDIEGRLWCGYLSESDFFDVDDSNDHNMISGLSVSYAPALFEGLSLFANRVYLSKWKTDNLRTIPSLFFVNLEGGGAQDVWDQRASIGFDYLLPKGGIEVYGEAGINDYGPSLDGYIRYPFHSIGYTSGLRKSVSLPFAIPLRGELLFEWTNLEVSQDFQFQWPSTFYAHHQITQGYTNGGQWLGAGNGTGGNSQYLGFKVYHPNGYVNLFIHRQNPDNDYIYAKSIYARSWSDDENPIEDFKAILSVGCQGMHYFTDSLSVQAGYSFMVIHNPLYQSRGWGRTTKMNNSSITLQFSYQL